MHLIVAKNGLEATLAAFDAGVAALPPIKRTYSGKPGCACGCRGTYTPATPRNTKAMLTRMRRMLVERPDAEVYIDDTYIWVETETRVNSVRCEA